MATENGRFLMLAPSPSINPGDRKYFLKKQKLTYI